MLQPDAGGLFAYIIMISFYFGLPGAGKTTTIAYFAKKYIDNPQYKYIYTNVKLDIPGVIFISKEDLGVYDITEGLVLYDEGGVDFDNRDFATFSKDNTWFFKYHRHAKLDVKIFSQTIDIDKKIRNLVSDVYYMYKPFISGRWITKIVRIEYGIAWPDKRTVGDVQEGYAAPSFIGKLLAQRIHRKRYYKYFDSYVLDRELKPLPPERYYRPTARTIPKSPQEHIRDFGRRLRDIWRILSGQVQLEEYYGELEEQQP